MSIGWVFDRNVSQKIHIILYVAVWLKICIRTILKTLLNILLIKLLKNIKFDKFGEFEFTLYLWLVVWVFNRNISQISYILEDRRVCFCSPSWSECQNLNVTTIFALNTAFFVSFRKYDHIPH